MRAMLCLLVVGCASGDGNVTIKMSDITVPAGGETYKCQNFANPFGGGAVDIDRFEAHMPAGVHHMIVFFVDGITDGGLEDCSGSEFHANVFGAQVPDSVIDLPSGIGVAVPAKTGLRFQLHFVNAATHDVSVGVTTKFHVATPGSITQHAGQLIFSNEDIDIPPTTTPVSVTKTCAVPMDVSLLGSSAHVHQHAVDFLAETNGTQLYHFTGGEPTPARYAPPIPVAANQGITWTCSYVNNGASDLVFGESAITNEMCVFGAIYYPVADVSFPNIPCF
jgi:hypothetical protein